MAHPDGMTQIDALIVKNMQSLTKKTKNNYFVHKFSSLEEADAWKSEIVNHLKAPNDMVLKAQFEKRIITS